MFDQLSFIKNKLDNLKHFSESLFEIAKSLLCINGGHVTIVKLILPNDKIFLMPIEIRDNSEKFLIWSMVADEVKRTGAKAILVISEVWVGPEDPKLPVRPSESPDRTEGLELTVVSDRGEEFLFFCPFERIDGSIVLGETIYSDKGHAFFLEPIRKVWGLSKKAKITLKKYKISRNSPCPCRSGKKFKKCCESISEEEDYLKKALKLYKQGDYEEAEKYFRKHLTKYITWYNEHAIPFLLTDPLNAEEFLLMDIDAISANVIYIVKCLLGQKKMKILYPLLIKLPI